MSPRAIGVHFILSGKPYESWRLTFSPVSTRHPLQGPLYLTPVKLYHLVSSFSQTTASCQLNKQESFPFSSVYPKTCLQWMCGYLSPRIVSDILRFTIRWSDLTYDQLFWVNHNHSRLWCSLVATTSVS
jgi:hypothetical protein